MMPMPAAFSDRMMLKSLSSSRTVSDEVGSSMIRTRAPRRQRLDDLDHLALREAEALDAVAGADRKVVGVEQPLRLAAQPTEIDAPAEPARLAAQQEVLGDGEVGQEAQLLEDHGDAARRACRAPTAR